MNPSQAYDFNSRRRRDEHKRRRVEAAVERLIRAFGLPPESGEALSEGVYSLYRNLAAQKLLDDQVRQYSKWVAVTWVTYSPDFAQ